MTPGPQLENGYTRIANELLEEVTKFDFSKRELKIVLAVIRLTYGFNKKFDDMSLSQLETRTGIKRTHLCNAINNLVSMRVLLKQSHVLPKQSHVHGQVIGLNKKYQEWEVWPKRSLLPKQSQRCDQNGNKGVTKTVNTKDKYKNKYKDREIQPVKPAFPPCPYQAIEDLYHEKLPELAANSDLDGIKVQINARWKKIPELSLWGQYFNKVRESQFLMGNISSSNRKPFKTSLRWLVDRSNFAKVLEGYYE